MEERGGEGVSVACQQGMDDANDRLILHVRCRWVSNSKDCDATTIRHLTTQSSHVPAEPMCCTSS